jgi:hypothetical protein
MKEDIELDVNTLNETQLFILLQSGEIDSCTYHECVQEINRNSISGKIFRGIRYILKIFKKKMKNSLTTIQKDSTLGHCQFI